MLDENRGGNDDAATVIGAHVGAGWREIDRRLRRVAKRRAALDVEESQLLVAAKRADVHVQLGYGSFIEYLERVCGYAPRTAQERMRVAEALEDLPAMRDALAAGEVSFSAVRELTRVVMPETEATWIAAIRGCTVREIEDAVRGHRAGDGPDDRPDPAIETRRVSLELTPDAYAMFLEARRALEHETGEPMTDAEFMAEACRRALSTDTAGRGNTPPHTIAITVCRDCDRGWQETGSKSIELSPASIERARCDATELGDVDGPTPAPTTRTIPAPLRRAVLARDHHRCTVPGCRSARYVDVHHLVLRSVGGPHTMSNLTTLCRRHHTSAHDGRITISGVAGALLITHADGRPYGMPPPSSSAPRPIVITDVDGRPYGMPPPSPIAPPPSVITDADGRPYGMPPPSPIAPPPSVITDVDGRPSGMPLPSPIAPTPSVITDVDGRPSGMPPPSSIALPSSVTTDVGDALVGMGVKRAVATRAVERAATHVGDAPSFDALLRASLRVLHPPQSIVPAARPSP